MTDEELLWTIIWYAIGVLGAIIFFIKWPIQSYFARQKSSVPKEFSIVITFGIICLTCYALFFLHDLIFTFVNACLLTISLLNLSSKEVKPQRKRMHGLRE